MLDAATPNTGTMPSNSPGVISGFTVIGNAAGASTARDATDVKGTSNPDIESTVTSAADVLANRVYGHRRFVSRPLAAQTFAAADGNWTFSFAWAESNTNHTSTGGLICRAYAWTPSSGLRNGSGSQFVGLSAVTTGGPTTETAYSTTAAWGATPLTISDGDILVFDVYTQFTQGMSTSYTETFAYNGITEASTTTCASFVAPPAPLTLFTAATDFPEVATARQRHSRRH